MITIIISTSVKALRKEVFIYKRKKLKLHISKRSYHISIRIIILIHKDKWLLIIDNIENQGI